MRNFFWVLLLLLFGGCNLSNNPNSVVEDYLGRYQMLDDSIDIDYRDLVGDVNISNNDIDVFNYYIKKQYRNMSYDIKETSIDGDKAKVTVEVEVYNYKDAINNSDYNDILSSLASVKDKVVYTVNFNLRYRDDKWEIGNINKEVKSKLLGIY